MKPAPNPRKSFWFFLIVFNLIALPALFTPVTIDGRLLARIAAVNLDSNVVVLP